MAERQARSGRNLCVIDFARGAMGGSYGLPQPVTSVTGFAMTHCKECGRRAVGDAGPYETVCRGGRLCPPGPGNAKPCRAGPVCPAGVRRKEESPSHGFAVPAPFRQGGRGNEGCGLPQPVTSVTGFAMTHCKECGRRADVGIGPYENDCRGGRPCPPGAVGS